MHKKKGAYGELEGKGEAYEEKSISTGTGSDYGSSIHQWMWRQYIGKRINRYRKQNRRECIYKE